MKKAASRLLVFSVFLLSIPTTFAQPRGTSSEEISHDDHGKHIVSAGLGMYGAGTNSLARGSNQDGYSMFLSGLFGIGADYEYAYRTNVSVGGFLRYYSTTDSIGGTEYTDRGTFVGTMARAYIINSDEFLGYASAGLNTVSVSHKRITGGSTSEANPDLGFGFNVSGGLMYKFTPTISGGVEMLRVLALGDKINGWVVEDLMFKIRVAL